MYSFEMAGSLILCMHGLLYFILADHIKTKKLANVLVKFTKVALILYSLIILIRICIFIKVHIEVLQVDKNDED